LEGITGQNSPPYWAAVRDDLITSYDALDECLSLLAEDTNEPVRLMARLTPLRLQDIIAWTVAQQHI
jgi:hypothetical protein